MRRSVADQKNPNLGNWSKWGRGCSNSTFFTEALDTMRELGVGEGAYAIGLVGSCDLPGICLRRAQSVLRDDQRPSYWSHAFIVTEPWDGKSRIGRLPIVEVPFFARNGQFPEPARNAVIHNTLTHYLDRRVDPNVALFTVAKSVRGKLKPLDQAQHEVLRKAIAEPNLDRARYDLWAGLGVWQQYFWSGEQLPNPTLAGQPIPSTSLIEMLYEQIGVDLTPAASERNSAPEHLWTSMRWWLQNDVQAHRGVDGSIVSGCYVIRDPGAGVLRYHGED
ncbi:MAG: hypothetical protein L0H54_06500 [Alcaligenaceae bacterium]|nr:hypothetical protein [Alcaligenaceae bacterium]